MFGKPAPVSVLYAWIHVCLFLLGFMTVIVVIRFLWWHCQRVHPWGGKKGQHWLWFGDRLHFSTQNQSWLQWATVAVAQWLWQWKVPGTKKYLSQKLDNFLQHEDFRGRPGVNVPDLDVSCLPLTLGSYFHRHWRGTMQSPSCRTCQWPPVEALANRLKRSTCYLVNSHRSTHLPRESVEVLAALATYPTSVRALG